VLDGKIEDDRVKVPLLLAVQISPDPLWNWAEVEPDANLIKTE
jgi:hypothetical protein